MTSANVCYWLQQQRSSHDDSMTHQSKNNRDRWIEDGVDGNGQGRPIVGGGNNHQEERDTTTTTTADDNDDNNDSCRGGGQW
jgi:hypothetical protein